MRLFVYGTRGFPQIQGGVEKHCEHIYPYLPDDIQVTVFRRKPYVGETPVYPNLRFIDLPSTRIKGFEPLFHSFLCTVVCLCKRPDAVHVHNFGPGIFIPLLRIFGLRVILTYHSANYEHRKWGGVSRLLLKASEQIALSCANRVIFVNEWVLNQQPERIRRKSVHIPNGVSGYRRIPRTGRISKLGLAEGKYILGVGRIAPEKGFDDLIRAFIQLDNREYSLVIAGGVEAEQAYYGKLLALAANHRVVFTGYVDEQLLGELYSHARLFVLPSHSEGFPLVVLEAMQFGCDILVSNLPAMRALPLKDGDYFENGDVDGLVAGLRMKLAGGRPSREYDMADYCWERVRRDTVGVIR